MDDGTRKVLVAFAGIVGFAASCIGIYAFFSGNDSLEEAYRSATSTPEVEVFEQQPELTETETLLVEPGISIDDTIDPTPNNLSGRRWEQVGLLSESVSHIVAGQHDIVYASTDENEHGIFKSEDNGSTWNAINNGLSPLDIEFLDMARDNPDRIIADGKGYLLNDALSINGGESWQIIEEPGRFEFTTTAFGSPDGREIYITPDTFNIFRSTDDAKTWQNVSSEKYMGCEALNFVFGSDVVYCLVTGERGRRTRKGEIYRSNDGGITWWEGVSVGDEYDIISYAIADVETIYVGTRYNGIWKSTDGGGSWTPMNNTLPRQGGELESGSVLVDPQNSNFVFASFFGEGVYHSQDGGLSWESLGQPGGDVRTLALTGESPRFLLAGTAGNGVWRTLLEQ